MRSPLVKQISANGKLLAIYISSDVSQPGIHFFTEEENSLQLGLMKRSSGYVVQLHRHLEIPRSVSETQEFILVRKGHIKVSIKDIDFSASLDLRRGDSILLMRGAHKIDFVEESEILEVKQGPFLGLSDKTLIND